MNLGIYDRELLDKHLLPELKEIAQSLGIVPDGNKTRRETWTLALVGQPFPLFQSIALEDEAVISNTESAGIFTGEGPPNRGDGRGGRVENSIDADRTQYPKPIEPIENQAQEPIETSPGVDRVHESIEFPDFESALAEIARLRDKNDKLMEFARSQAEIIRRAKDISPVKRPSLCRVTRLAQAACLDVSRALTRGWMLTMGEKLKRGFNTLKEIWELLIVEDWHLADLFRRPLSVVGRPIFAAATHTKYSAIPFCDDDLIDIWSLGVNAVSGGRSPPQEVSM